MRVSYMNCEVHLCKAFDRLVDNSLVVSDSFLLAESRKMVLRDLTVFGFLMEMEAKDIR